MSSTVITPAWSRLVDHYREMTAALFEFVQQFRQNLGLRHYKHIVLMWAI